MHPNKPKITLSRWEVAPNFEPSPTDVESFYDFMVATEGSNRPAGAAQCVINNDGFAINFLRFLDEDEEYDWVFVDYDGALQKSGEPYDMSLDSSSPNEEKGYHANLGRLFNACALGYGNDESLFISVGWFGVAGWFSTRRACVNSGFRLNPDIIGLLHETPVTVIRETLQKELLNPDSDACFALKWADTGDDQKFRTVYRTKKGDWEEFAALLHAVEVIFFSADGDYFFFKESEYNGYYSRSGKPDKAARRRHLWNLELVRYFEPHIAENLNENRVVAGWAAVAGRFRKVSSVPPSAHDELEAASLLYNWAHKNMPPKKLKLLLPY